MNMTFYKSFLTFLELRPFLWYHILPPHYHLPLPLPSLSPPGPDESSEWQIPKGRRTPLTIPHRVTQRDIQGLSLFIVEHVQLTVWLAHPCRGKIEVKVISPAGTVSMLAATRSVLFVAYFLLSLQLFHFALMTSLLSKILIFIFCHTRFIRNCIIKFWWFHIQDTWNEFYMWVCFLYCISPPHCLA